MNTLDQLLDQTPDPNAPVLTIDTFEAIMGNISLLSQSLPRRRLLWSIEPFGDAIHPGAKLNLRVVGSETLTPIHVVAVERGVAVVEER